MTVPEDPWWRDFIGATPARTAKLATIRADGAPHVAPVWVAFDGDDVVFNTGATTSKGKALRRDPRVAMCFDDERPPFAFVLVRGAAVTSEDPEELRHWATVIAARYMGGDQADAYGRRNAVPGELLVRVTVDQVIAAQGIAT